MRKCLASVRKGTDLANLRAEAKHLRNEAENAKREPFPRFPRP